MHGENERFGAFSRWCGRHAWWVLGFWAVVAIAGNVFIPQLEHTVAERSAPFLPANIQAAETLRSMSDAFGVPASSALGSIVVSDDRGIGPDAEAAYRELVEELRADTDDVAYVLDLYTDPALRSIGLSPDGKAINLVLAGTGDVGSTRAHRNTVAVRDLIDTIDTPPEVEMHLTGPSPTLADLFSSIDVSLILITGVSVLLITLVLLAVYRSLVTALIPLATIGIALGVARPIVSLLGATGVLTVSNFTIALMTAMLLGATTDYAIFSLASYHEARRAGLPAIDAVTYAGSRVSGILIASMLTIAAASVAMGFAKLGMFLTAGPPIAIGVVVSLCVSMTVPYAALAILGRRGFAEPRPLNERRWRRIGSTVVRHSTALAVAAMVFLLAAASVLLTFRVNFDENAMQLDRTDSRVGYEVVQRHWDVNEAAPEYLVVSADHDMRTTDDLAALDRIAQRLSTIPEVARVRSITRPAGEQLPETTVGYQAGVVAGQLGSARDRVQASAPDVGRLASGAARLQAGAAAADARIPELTSGIRDVTSLAREVLSGYEDATSAVRTVSGGTVDVDGLLTDLGSWMGLLDVALTTVENDVALLDTARGVADALGPALADGPQCDTNPLCAQARSHLDALDSMSGGVVTRSLRQVQALAATPRDAIERIRTAEPRIRDLLGSLRRLTSTAQAGDAQRARADLERLVAGAEDLAVGMNRLATGLGQVEDGVGRVVDMTGELSDGLTRATDYLATLGEHTAGGPGSGFYLPAAGFADPRFASASGLLFAPDGRTARLLVIWKANPYGAEALDASRTLAPIASEAARGTTLQQAEFAVTGLASLSADTRDQMWRDFAVFGTVAMLGVLLVLMVLLRSIAAPVLMVAVVALSFAAAAGISVLVWQHVIGIDLDWSVLPVSFMALIAVGADYSMLFAARIRESSADGSVIRGLLRSFGTTGSVITTAGVVFALTMFALMSGRVVNLLQIGFTVGVGLLIDISVVRTILVPAGMALLGDRVWWPARPHRSSDAAE